MILRTSQSCPTVSAVLTLTVLLSALFAPAIAFAQNMQVIGGSSVAQACYRASTAAAMTGSAGRLDTESCDSAIQHGNLRRRDLVATYVNRGVINVAREEFNAAAKDYNQAIALDPNVAEAYLNRGNLWFMANRYSEAILDYDRALELNVAQPFVALLNRGMVRETVGQLELAQADYLAALEKRENWSVAEQKLARVTKKLAQAANSENAKEQEKD